MFSFLAVFSTAQGWIELGTLIFLEMVLGIDNLVFIAITTDRLPESKRHIGRRFGLLAALCMRIMLLCMISWLASLHTTLFTIPFLSGEMAQITARDIIMLAGGLYLIYKGISELISKIRIESEDVDVRGEGKERKHINLAHAIALIAVMDIIFSLDSVITAVGMVNELPIMIAAVIIAVMVMIIFADPISEFINKHSGIKILALSFIAFIGVVLTCEGLNVELSTPAVYFSMGFALIVQIIEIKWDKKGAFITIAALFAATLGISFLVKPITWWMPIVGAVASFVIIGLLALYDKNLAVAMAEGEAHHEAKNDKIQNGGMLKGE